jgi:hypothetical protein
MAARFDGLRWDGIRSGCKKMAFLGLCRSWADGFWSTDYSFKNHAFLDRASYLDRDAYVGDWIDRSFVYIPLLSLRGEYVSSYSSFLLPKVLNTAEGFVT